MEPTYAIAGINLTTGKEIQRENLTRDVAIGILTADLSVNGVVYECRDGKDRPIAHRPEYLAVRNIRKPS